MQLEIPIFSFIFLGLLPLPIYYHLRTKFASTIIFIFWIVILNFIYAVNTIIWAGNVNVVASGWCDISSKILVGWPTALSAYCLCFSMQLYDLTRGLDRDNARSKRLRQFRGCALCLGLPILVMIIHIAFQTHRFDINEDFGCFPSIFVTWLSIVLLWCPPMVMALLSMFYAALVSRFIRQRWIELEGISLPSEVWTRLSLHVCLAVVEAVVVVAVMIFDLVVYAPFYQPLADLRGNIWQFSRIDTFSFDSAPPNHYAYLNLSYLLVLYPTVAFVGTFHFCHGDIRKLFRRFFHSIRALVLRQDLPDEPDTDGQPASLYLTSRALQFARATHSPQTTLHVELQDTRVNLPSRSTTRTSETFDNDRRERDDGHILPAVPGVKPPGHSIA